MNQTRSAAVSSGIALPSSDRGTGVPTLVLMHSFGSARGEWNECAAILSTRYRCVALDLPGHGEAARVCGYDVAAAGDAVLHTVTQLGVGPFILVGHSMSGKIAMTVAAGRTPELAGLVLVTPSPPAPEPIAPDARRRMLAMARTIACAGDFLDNVTASALVGTARDRAVDDFLACAPAAWVAWLECGSNEDWVERVGTIGCPTLVITGDRDPALPAAVQRSMTMPHLAAGELTTLSNCGHLPTVEQPGALAGLIADFVRRRVMSPTESLS